MSSLPDTMSMKLTSWGRSMSPNSKLYLNTVEMHICISQYGRQVAIYAFLTFSFLENPQLRKQRKEVDFLGFLRPKTVKLKKNDFWFQFYAHKGRLQK
jgi:hypothetical protein